MPENVIDYPAVLADLEARRDVLNSMIEGVRQIILGQAPVSAIGTAAPAQTFDAHEIPADAFFNMSIADAARKFLAAVKRKQSTRQIAEALQVGGLTLRGSQVRSLPPLLGSL